jgi:tetratricopeptide (TPR) repeat protein
MLKRVAFLVLGLAVVGAAIGLGYSWMRSLPLAEARRALREGRFETAAQLAETRLAQGHPGDREAILLAARAYAQAGRLAESEAYFTQVPLRAPDDLRLRARGLETRRLWSEAATVYEQLLHQRAADGDSLQHLAAIRVQQDRPQEALILARRLAQVPAYEAVGLVIAAMVENQMGNITKAVEDYEEALRLSPDLKGVPTERWQVLEFLAQALIELGRAEQSEKYALEVQQQTSGPTPCFILGQARQQLGDEDGAYNYWKEALARDPNYRAAIIEIAQLHLRRRNLQEAMTWAQRAGELDPEDATITYLISTIRKHIEQRGKSGIPSNSDSP